MEPAEGRARIRVSQRVRVIAGLFTGREGVVADVRGVSRWCAEARVCVRLQPAAVSVAAQEAPSPGAAHRVWM